MNDVLLPHVKLRFNIDYPSLEESYVFGYECAFNDVAESENPFVIGTKEHEHWGDGWWAGFYGEEPAFSLNDDYEVVFQKDGSANDHTYHEPKDNFFIKFLEISGVLVVSAIVGYQLFELVA